MIVNNHYSYKIQRAVLSHLGCRPQCIQKITWRVCHHQHHQHWGILSSARQSLYSPCHTGEGLVKVFGEVYPMCQSVPYRLSWVCSGHLLLYWNLFPLKVKAPVKPWKAKRQVKLVFFLVKTVLIAFSDSLHCYITGSPYVPSLTSLTVFPKWQ